MNAIVQELLSTGIQEIFSIIRERLNAQDAPLPADEQKKCDALTHCCAILGEHQAQEFCKTALEKPVSTEEVK